jgi:hypothetical protein
MSLAIHESRLSLNSDTGLLPEPSPIGDSSLNSDQCLTRIFIIVATALYGTLRNSSRTFCMAGDVLLQQGDDTDHKRAAIPRVMQS